MSQNALLTILTLLKSHHWVICFKKPTFKQAFHYIFVTVTFITFHSCPVTFITKSENILLLVLLSCLLTLFVFNYYFMRHFLCFRKWYILFFDKQFDVISISKYQHTCHVTCIADIVGIWPLPINIAYFGHNTRHLAYLLSIYIVCML